MPHIFSSPKSSTRTTKGEKVKEKKSVEKIGEVGEKKEIEVTPKTPRTHNKLHKLSPFSLSTPPPSSRKRTTSLFTKRASAVHIASLSTDSSSDTSSSSIERSSSETPTKVKPEQKHRLRTISLRSVRSLSSSLRHHYSQSSQSSCSAASTTSSESSTIDRGESTMTPSVSMTDSRVSPSPSGSPMKDMPHKVVSKVKKSLRRLGSSMHFPHVTSHSPRPRSSSDSTSSRPVDLDHSTPFPPPISTALDLGYERSRKVSNNKVRFDGNREAEVKVGEEEEQVPVLELTEARSSSSSTEDSIGLQIHGSPSDVSSVIVPTILSPVEEMPTPIERTPIEVKSASSEATSVSGTTVNIEPVSYTINEEGNWKLVGEKGDDGEMEKEGPKECELSMAEMDKLTTKVFFAATTEHIPIVISPPSPLNVNQDLPPSEEGCCLPEGEEMSSSNLPVTNLTNPIPFLPNANARHSFCSTNMLLWWFPKSTSMYHKCTKSFH